MKTKYIHFTLAPLIIILAVLLLAISCKKENNDNNDNPTPPILPECKIIIPDDSSMVQIGNIVSVEASIIGFSSDAKVAFSIDTSTVSETSVDPYNFQWDTEGWELGSHIVRADAYDENNLITDEIIVFLIDTILPLMPPVPVINIAPEEGNTDTIFSFDASGSYDNEDPAEALLFRWDFEGDGYWDTEFTHESEFEHKYTHPNNYQVRLEVMDTDGMISDTVKSLMVGHSGNPDACEGYVTVPHGGQVYHTVAIGDQCWLRENLNIGVMAKGGEVPSNNDTIEKYCFDDDTANCNKYGGLYMWKEMMNHFPLQGSQGICPNGWHIPSDDEWKELEGFVDSQHGVGDPVWDEIYYRGFDAGKHLKALLGWISGGNGDNSFDFKALPGGYWEISFSFVRAGEEAHFWSSTHDSGHNGRERTLKYDNDQVSRSYSWDESAFSVRCLRD